MCIVAVSAQTPARCPSIKTQSTKSWSCRTGTRGSRGRKQSSFTQIIRNASTASPRCCARSLWLVSDFTGRQSGAESFPSGWPTRASVARGRTRTACWATTTSLGVSSARTRATLPGTTKQTEIFLMLPGPRALACTWIMQATPWPFIQYLGLWSLSTDSKLSSVSLCMLALVWAPLLPSASWSRVMCLTKGTNTGKSWALCVIYWL